MAEWSISNCDYKLLNDSMNAVGRSSIMPRKTMFSRCFMPGDWQKKDLPGRALRRKISITGDSECSKSDAGSGAARISCRLSTDDGAGESHRLVG